MELVVIACAYMILGIGFNKLFYAYDKDSSIWVLATFLWPIGLVISAFWNYEK